MKQFFLPLLLLAACTQSGNKKTNSADSVATSSQPAAVTKPSFEVFTFAKENFAGKKMVPGTFSDGVHWKDATGEHVALLMEKDSDRVKSKDPERDEVSNKSITVYQFSLINGNWQSGWKVTDGIDECEFDNTTAFFPGALIVTDADKNDTAEVTMVYQLGCRSDVSPDTKKLIMYEGKTKYAIRGETAVTFSQENKTYGGAKNIDDNLKNAKPALLAHANAVWEKFGKEKY
jgi:hypothetical protein